MKKGFLREKAILQILLLLTAIIYFSYAIKPAEAQSNACCEKTKDGEYCLYTNSNNCDSNYQQASTSCEQTSFCKVGCCYDLEEGICYKSVSQAKCLSIEGGELYNDKTCDSVAACQPGCCVIGSQCMFTTEQSCALKTAGYEDLEMIFQNVNTESECQAICRAGDQGCCVTDDSCIYETRESCEAAQGEFYYEQYCSDVALCGCAEHYKKTCYDDDVYWLDSCGNREGLAEDCDYAQGTLCKEINGEYSCGSVHCETTYKDEKNTHDTSMGGFRKNGESWCVYESPVGNALDRPGTRHYRHMCVNGEEIVESCRDYREEICIQGESDMMTESQCIYNDIYDTAVTQEVSSVPKGQEFWETNMQSRCEEADSDCPVVWVKEHEFDDWSCESNCECEQAKHVKDMAEYCKFMGDCGADFNIAGKFTHDGFTVTGRGKEGPPTGLSDSQKQDWNKYGVYGNMLGLYETILEAMAIILASGTKAATEAKEAQAELNKKGMYTGIALGIGTYLLAGYEAVAGTWLMVGSVCWPCLVVIAIIVILTMTGDTETYHVTTKCSEWQAPTGGEDCEKCLDQKKVDKLGFYDTCTEYKCKSLGMNCEYIAENAGTERVACYNSNPNDVNSPVISPWEEALTEGFSVSTISQGYEIIPKVPYYEKIKFGIKTNELSQCKISDEHTNSYETMVSYFGDSYYQLEHNITVNPQVGGQTYDYYVRCQDPSGNSNAAEYVIRFTTEDEPDLTAPSIEGTSITDYGYIAANVNETSLAVYVNEPANCKLSLNDKTYDEMENSLQCSYSSTNALGYDTYPCYTTLSLEEGSNVYYFRCEDKSENQMQQSYAFHLTKTNELKIISQSPEGTVEETSTTLMVTTSGGAENGKATCYYSDDETREVLLWPEFYETDSTIHYQQLLSLAQGGHNYYILCKDVAPNEANTTIIFTIQAPEEDVTPPNLEYIYIDSVVLHVILDEEATCEYGYETFSYGEGTVMQGAGTKHHTISASEDHYYINCEDANNNHWTSPIIVYL